MFARQCAVMCASVRCYARASVRLLCLRVSALRVCALRVCALLRLRVCALRLCAPVLYFGSHPAWGGCRCAPRLRRSSLVGWARLPPARLCAVTSARLCAAPPCARPVLRLSSRVGWVSLCTATSSLIPHGVGAVALCASVRCYVCASVRCYVCASVRPSCTSALIPRGVGIVVHRDFVAHPTWGGRGCPLRVCALRVRALLHLRVSAPILYFNSHQRLLYRKSISNSTFSQSFSQMP
ncbi:hypothetical protein B0H11DRAFT_2318563 [Mycena galericulata]|nr:hypothetical protein B0H11DRAFT_2318563 [Mycena galericulata]